MLSRIMRLFLRVLKGLIRHSRRIHTHTEKVERQMNALADHAAVFTCIKGLNTALKRGPLTQKKANTPIHIHTYIHTHNLLRKTSTCIKKFRIKSPASFHVIPQGILRVLQARLDLLIFLAVSCAASLCRCVFE
jgi:hypothetical protein